MNPFFRYVALAPFCTLITEKAFSRTNFENDIALIRNCDLKDRPLNPLLAFNTLRKTRPTWWKIMPQTMSIVQEKIENKTLSETFPEKKPSKKEIIRLFLRHPPRTLNGWKAYRMACYASFQAPQQRQDACDAFQKFWIQSRMSLADQEMFCASFLNGPYTKNKKGYTWATQETHINRMIGLLLETGLMASQKIECAKKLGQWMNLSPDHPLMLICRILTRKAHIKDPSAIKKIEKLPIAIRSRPLISMAQVRYFIRCNQLDRAVKAWHAGRLGQGVAFKDLFFATKARETLKETGLALMHNLWTKGQEERTKGQKTKARSTFKTVLKGPFPIFFTQSVDFLCLRGLIFYDGMGYSQSALINFQKALRLIDTKKSMEKGPLCRHKAKALFWSGLCYERMKDRKKALKNWEKASRYGFYFYGQMAQYKMGRPITMHFSKADIHKGLQRPLQKEMVRIINALHTQDKTHQYPIVNAVIKDLGSIAKTSHDKKKALLIIKRLTPSAVTYAAKMMSRDAASIFPPAYPMAPVTIPYKDPALIQAIILSESAFNPKAISAVGAQGLMQVMPQEAEAFCAQLGIVCKPEHIFDPRINIALGIEVFKDKQKKMTSLIPTLASYNAGETKVSEWLARTKNLKTDQDTWVWIESIPFEETRHYVPRNLANYATYRWMNQKPLFPKDVGTMLSIQKRA